MRCPNCSAWTPENARFCPQCGERLPAPSRSTLESSGAPTGWGTFFMTLALSLALSFVLTVVLGFPVFILGAILPLLWWSRPRR